MAVKNNFVYLSLLLFLFLTLFHPSFLIRALAQTVMLIT